MTRLTPPLEKLLAHLATGRYYSGEELGRLLGVSRTAIWKMINKLQAWDVRIERIPNKGYRLYHGYQPLVQEKILAAITSENRSKLSQIIIKPIVDSTNNYLLQHRDLASGTVCLAEYQSNGRGRRQRAWHAPFGKHILMSVRWEFTQGPAAIVGLSMAIALALVRAFEAYGLDGLQLKWPNDVLWQGRKLAGVLVETFIDSVGICHLVAGMGVNVEHAPFDQKTTSLEDILQQVPDRNRVAGLILDQLLRIIPTFADTGFAAYQREWSAYDFLSGKKVNILGLPTDMEGDVVGIDAQGGLMVKQDETVTVFHTGEVSVRQVR